MLPQNSYTSSFDEENVMKKAIVFALVLLTVLGCINRVLSLKSGDGIYSLTKYYQLEDDTLDVLVLGSSHAFENINPVIMWQEHGIASFDLCGSEQPAWNTYFYLKEALKSQRPKLVVFEAFSVAYLNEDYADESRIAKNNFGLKLSKDKIESVIVSSPPERRADFLLQFPIYHTRYTELASSDFLRDQGMSVYRYFLGYGTNFDTTPLEMPDAKNVRDCAKLHPKSEEYLLKIIQLCHAEKIPLMIVVAPYALSEREQEAYNTVGRIAQVNDVPFINYNLLYDVIRLDFETDFAGSHLNYLGNVKMTKHLADHIVENYDIPNRKGDPGYVRWEEASLYYNRTIENFRLAERKRLSGYASLLDGGQYRAILSVPAAQSYCREDIMQLGALGFSQEQIEKGGVYFLQDGGNKVAMQRISLPFTVEMGQDTYLLDGDMQLTLLKEPVFQLDADRVTLVLFDDITCSLVGCVPFAFQDGVLTAVDNSDA